jgi:hypothetical protein
MVKKLKFNPAITPAVMQIFGKVGLVPVCITASVRLHSVGGAELS